jgi:hypothetical protein
MNELIFDILRTSPIDDDDAEHLSIEGLIIDAIHTALAGVTLPGRKISIMSRLVPGPPIPGRPVLDDPRGGGQVGVVADPPYGGRPQPDSPGGGGQTSVVTIRIVG